MLFHVKPSVILLDFDLEVAERKESNEIDRLAALKIRFSEYYVA